MSKRSKDLILDEKGSRFDIQETNNEKKAAQESHNKHVGTIFFITTVII